MTRKGTAGRMPQSNIGANESLTDKATKKVKDMFDGDNEATNYDDIDHDAGAMEYSKRKQAEEDREKE
ncbi:hypothetical protein [Planomicrobium sp. CPCC 101079]|uniref:hypothetical protein n=1 Tax=Planomicrobium sp. CPCC 101079 TaxID=2599618 RepID=UPI0011B74431|nr:hypothetical protein [Planomicrobium sp. CPCC 101079]TWT03618.1 hypothetical protein FQV28_11405 [Planomicrobium sp. CPCC 101079]